MYLYSTHMPLRCAKGQPFWPYLLRPSRPRPLKYPPNITFPTVKIQFPHDGRAPIIVRVKSLLVFLSPCRQMPGLYLNYTMTASLQFLSNSSSSNPSACQMLCTYDTVGVVRYPIKNMNWRFAISKPTKTDLLRIHFTVRVSQACLFPDR